MMQRQLELRREETKEIHEYVHDVIHSCFTEFAHRKCDELEAKLEQLSTLATQDSEDDTVKGETAQTLQPGTQPGGGDQEEKAVLVRADVQVKFVLIMELSSSYRTHLPLL